MDSLSVIADICNICAIVCLMIQLIDCFFKVLDPGKLCTTREKMVEEPVSWPDHSSSSPAQMPRHHAARGNA